MEHPILDFINKARKRFEMVGAGLSQTDLKIIAERE
tara:strand:+ start:1246 stop:1353 length:108 start_codon:yes stop_codon:yes gene_type:complete